jgi:hypothetical protein
MPLSLEFPLNPANGQIHTQNGKSWVFDITIPAWKQLPVTVTTVAQLQGPQGTMAMVTDSSVAAANNFGAVVAGGGAHAVPVYNDGTNWRIG